MSLSRDLQRLSGASLMTMAIDLETITDELEREATIGIIHNCEKMLTVGLDLLTLLILSRPDA